MWAGALLLLVGVAMAASKARARPFTFAELERSHTAAAFGLDNTIPLDQHSEARGLAIVAGELRGLGLRITSAYRSGTLNALLKFIQENPGVSPDPQLLAPSSRQRPHVACRALDLGAGRSSVAAVRRTLAKSQHAAHVTNNGGLGLDEGNHLHVEFSIAYLRSLDDGVRE